MSKAFGDYVEQSGLVFDNREDRLAEFRRWKKETKVYGESRTEQHHADDLDLNKVFPKFDKAGMARLKQQVTVDEEALMDLVGMDYTKSMMELKRVESEFNELPSGVRNKFKNEPGEYLKYLSRPQKAAEEVKEIVPEVDTPKKEDTQPVAPTEPSAPE